MNFRSAAAISPLSWDEFGSTTGLVTVEDALEQLVGEMEDEFDVSPRRTRSGQDEVLLLDGSVNLRDLEVQMHWQLPRDGGIETLAGFLLTRLGKIHLGRREAWTTMAAGTLLWR